MANKRKADVPALPTSELVSKGHPCPDQVACGSSDAAALYDDGHLFCFACSRRFAGDGVSEPSAHTAVETTSDDLQSILNAGRITAIPSRGLSQATCELWDYRVRINPRNAHREHLAPYRDEHGRCTGIKVRDTGTPEEPCKDFRAEGKIGATLFGRHKWAAGGKRLVIVGGEIDCLTVSQQYAHKWPVVSPPSGEPSAPGVILKNLEWVSSFEEVCIGLDMDEPGRKASLEIAKLLPPGKAKIIKWSRKDPNEMLMNGEGEKITLNIYNAEAYRPDGIVDARTLTSACMATPTMGLPWPWPFLNTWTFGRHRGQLITLGSGTGMGKSDLMAEVIASTLKGADEYGNTWTPEGFAVFGFEEDAEGTKKQIASKIGSKLFHLPPDDNGMGWTDEELLATLTRMDTDIWHGGGKLFINDNFGTADWDDIKSRSRYLAAAEGIKHFLVDPLGALVVGVEDERKELDRITLEGSMLAQELDATVYFVSHLTRPSLGPSHEEGGHVRLSQFRGSNGIGMYAALVLGWEGNQQAETTEEQSKRILRGVKARKGGRATGKVQTFIYNVLTGRLELPYEMYQGDT